MKIYNKGSRVFNPNSPGAIRPGVWTEVEDKEAERLLKLYPRELTTNSAAVTIVNPALEAENKRLKAENARLTTQMANMEKLITGGKGSNVPDLAGEATAAGPAVVLPAPSSKPAPPARKAAPVAAH